jgi:hypothetical protein
VSRATGLNSSSARGASLARTIKPSLPGVASKTAGFPLINQFQAEVFSLRDDDAVENPASPNHYLSLLLFILLE